MTYAEWFRRKFGKPVVYKKEFKEAYERWQECEKHYYLMADGRCTCHEERTTDETYKSA